MSYTGILAYTEVRRKTLSVMPDVLISGTGSWKFATSDGKDYQVSLAMIHDQVILGIYSCDSGYLIPAPLWAMNFRLDSPSDWQELHGAIFHIQTNVSCPYHCGPETDCCRQLKGLLKQVQMLVEEVAELRGVVASRVSDSGSQS